MQLKRNLDISPLGTFGIAAISLSCAFNPGDKVFSGDMQELGVLLDKYLTNIVLILARWMIQESVAFYFILLHRLSQTVWI